MLKGAGFEIIDLATMSPPALRRDAKKHDAAVIGLSALLTTTMPVMKQVVDLVRAEAGDHDPGHRRWRSRLRRFAREIGADAYGYDAAHAVDQVKALMGARPRAR